jgi:hypothetical protein
MEESRCCQGIDKEEEEMNAREGIRVSVCRHCGKDAGCPHQMEYAEGKKNGKAEALREVLKIINKTKLPTDKDYRYSNEYIEEWIEELKLNLQEAKR